MGLGFGTSGKSSSGIPGILPIVSLMAFSNIFNPLFKPSTNKLIGKKAISCATLNTELRNMINMFPMSMKRFCGFLIQSNTLSTRNPVNTFDKKLNILAKISAKGLNTFLATSPAFFIALPRPSNLFSFSLFFAFSPCTLALLAAFSSAFCCPVMFSRIFRRLDSILVRLGATTLVKKSLSPCSFCG